MLRTRRTTGTGSSSGVGGVGDAVFYGDGNGGDDGGGDGWWG